MSKTIEFMEMTTPSDALQAMVDGLLRNSRRKDFKVDMGTFGRAADGICFGCAATCAVQEASGKQFVFEELRGIYGLNSRFRNLSIGAQAECLGENYVKLATLENAIDGARQGYLRELFRYFGLGDEHRQGYDERFELKTHNWRDQLGAVCDLIEELEAQGL